MTLRQSDIKPRCSYLLLFGILLNCLLEATVCQETLAFVNPANPVAISFLVADLKYSPDKKVKICEIQQGIVSTYSGDDYLHGGRGEISANFCNYLKKWGLHGWTNIDQIREAEIKRMISEDRENWTLLTKITDLDRDSTLKTLEQQPIYDSSHISNYHGLLFVRPHTIKSLPKFHKKHSGIIPIDEYAFKYWEDKYKMNRLLDEIPEIKKLRPRWKSYPKKYKKTLADKIKKHLKSDIFVIKPRGSYRGRGVIIVAKEDLDKTLEAILKNPKRLEHHPDPSYSYWFKDSFGTFIIEEFIPAMPITLDEVDGLSYDTTMRITFILVYENNMLNIHYTGAYNKFPLLPLTADGTLNEKHKSLSREPYFSLPKDEILEDVKGQLSKPLLLLFKKMINKS